MKMHICVFPRLRGALLFLILALPVSLGAHVGSPDVYYDGHPGPYHLLVTVRTPAVLPGLAQTQIRELSKNVSQVYILPARKLRPRPRPAPRPDAAPHSSADQPFVIAD